jgi:hypothetical protein
VSFYTFNCFRDLDGLAKVSTMKFFLYLECLIVPCFICRRIMMLMFVVSEY